jgi:translocation and assembly module TamB
MFRRRLVHALLVLLLGTVPMVLGIVVAMTATGPGRSLLARGVSRYLDTMFRGDVEVGAISGSFLFGLNIDSLTIRDTAGVIFAQVPRLEVGYSIPNFLANRIVLSGVRMVQPTIQLIKHRNGRMNYEEILRLGEGQGGKPSPLVELRDLQVDNGTVRIYTPWRFKDGITGEAEREAALAAERAKPGRVIEESSEGLRKVVTAEALTARLPLLRLATPQKDPLEVEIDSLAVRFSDPAVAIRDFVGRLRLKNDSLTISVVRGALPNSEFHGGGIISFPQDTILYDLALEVPRLDLKDLRWISPDFPDMVGRGNLAANNESATRSVYVLDDLHLEQGRSSIDGNVTVVLDARRGLGVRNMQVRVENLDLDVPRPYLDTLPLDGTITGNLGAHGYFDSMGVNLDLGFDDARIEGGANSTITAEGILHFGGPEGAIFDDFLISVSDFDLRSIRLVSPAVRLNGRTQLAGTLDGPWKNVVFEGRVEHRDGEGELSAIEGLVRLDTRGEVLGLETDIALDPVDFDGIRGSFPGLTLDGELTGTLRSVGDLSRLSIDADVQGDLGTIRALGYVTLLPPRLGADSLSLVFSNLNLAAIQDSALPTRLNGHALVSMTKDTLVAPEGTLSVTLDTSFVREFRLDSLRTQLAIRDSIIHLDTLEAGWGDEETGGRVSGRGTLGWSRPHTGEMAVSATATSLTPFDSLLIKLTNTRRDTTKVQEPLSGSATADLVLTGSLDSLLARGTMILQDFRWQSTRSPGAVATLEWTGGSRHRAAISLRSDSVTVGTGVYTNIGVNLAGWTDSLSWSGSLKVGERADLSGGGRWWERNQEGWILSVDTMTARLPEHTWRLIAPSDIAIGDDVLRFTDLELHTEDGSGSLKLAGELPRNSPGRLTIEGKQIALRDIYALMQKDTTGMAGNLSLDVEFAGTAAEPTISGTGTLGDLILGDFRSPFVQGVFDYRNHRLDANLLLWRTGVQVLRVEARLPLDLALRGVERRQLPGELFIRADADSVNLALLEAFTPAIRRVQGLLRMDVEITGSWEAPRMAGSLEVIGGAATLPSLGVRYGYMNGKFDFVGDSIVVERFRTTSGPGELILSGSIKLERLTNPVLSLELEAQNFRAINNPTFLTLEASGKGKLEGPVYGAVLTGDIVANQGELHFADLLTKRIVNLSSPEYADLIDTTLIRTRKLGADFQSVFLDSLNIRDLNLTVQDQFWLRSSDANIQLEGSVEVNKTGRTYRFDGTFTAIRGTYTLHIGFITRDFQVRRGTVRYFGTPDLNAELDIEAEHIVQAGSDEIPIIARITGTMLIPRLSLESTIRPAPSESELVSYLMFGRPSPELPGAGVTDAAQQQAALETGLAYLGSALSTEIQRTLISDIGIPVDFFEIRAGGGNIFSSQGSNQITAGWQLGTKVFFTVNAGFCNNFSNLDRASFGTGLEYRASRSWRFQTSYEPLINCRPAGSPSNPQESYKYQFGIDALWEKEY